MPNQPPPAPVAVAARMHPFRFQSARGPLLAALLGLAASTLPAQSMTERLAAALDGEAPTTASATAMVVVDLATGETLFARHAERPVVPGPAMRLLTTAAALELLGPEHRFVTTLGVTAPPVDGLVVGDLVLVAGGDPAFTSEDLRAMVGTLHSTHAVARVTGNLVGDVTLFALAPKGPGWAWDEDSDPAAMSISPMMMNHNTLTVKVDPVTPGYPPMVALDPPADYPPVANSAMTVPAGTPATLTIGRPPFEDLITITGDLPGGAAATTRRLAMHDPARWVRSVLRAELAGANITLLGNDVLATAPADAPFALMVQHDSPPVGELIALCNKPGENAIAEMLLQHAARKAQGTVTSWAEGRRTLTHWLTTTVGADPGAFHVADGSGVSRQNLLTAGAAVAVLRHVWGQPHGATFADSLAVAGIDGSLAGRMKSTPAENRVRATAGTMAGTTAVAGYATTTAGRQLAFAILTAGHTAGPAPVRQLQDRLLTIIVSE